MEMLKKFFAGIVHALPFLGMFVVILVFHFTDFVCLKFYPVIINFCLFVIFFSSIFKEKTVIQKFALLKEPDCKPIVMEYTRKLTYWWSAFMFINFLISFVTVFLSNKIWTIYNGLISYILVGTFFVIEYIIRINFKRKHGC